MSTCCCTGKTAEQKIHACWPEVSEAPLTGVRAKPPFRKKHHHCTTQFLVYDT